MSPFVQELIVALIVAGAVTYAALRLSPRGLRLPFARAVARLALRLGVSSVDARRVEAKLSTGGACGSCDECKACATVEPTPSGRRVIPIRSTGR
jgi:hypothetical protein